MEAGLFISFLKDSVVTCKGFEMACTCSVFSRPGGMTCESLFLTVKI